MSNNVDLSGFFAKLDAILKAYNKFPAEISTMAVNFSKERFKEQAWLDSTKDKWVPRKRARGRTVKRSQTLLVDTGRLKRSIRKVKVTSDQIIIGTDVPYARIHNDGGTINKTVNVKAHTVRSHRRKAYTRTRGGNIERIKSQAVKSYTVKAHSRDMNMTIPRRRFIGESYTLQRRIELHVTARFMRALK